MKSIGALIAWLGDGGKPVAPELAQARASVCIKCPMNQTGSKVVQSVAGLIRKQIELKAEMKLAVQGEENLHVCSACGCALKLKIHAPIKYIEETTPDEDLPAFDPMCWILKEIAGK